MTLAFIHIGKTGGTTLNRLLRTLKNYKEYHLRHIYGENEKYIIWIRNPIHRFVSAFNQSYYAIHTDASTITEFNLNTCLIPFHMRRKHTMSKPYIFSPGYDALMKQFTSANHLAESLTSSDPTLRQKAIELMNRREEHLFKGIHWYLLKNDFLNKHRDNILFVGRTEHMKEDIRALANKLNITLDETLKLRENIYVDKSMKYLSPLAIKNIIDWFNDTEYVALKQLVTDGWIDKATLKMYYTYEFDMHK
jgi:hypothetical protein